MSVSKLAVTIVMLMAGQAPSSDVVYTKLRIGDLPAELDPARRDEVREMKLYMSGDQGRSYGLIDRCLPGKSNFHYDVKVDGEYWFQVATVNQQGKEEPDGVGIYKLPPKLKMIVDTQPPVVKIQSAQRQGDELVVSWEVQEQYPDPATLALEYRPTDSQAWIPVPLTPSPVGTKRVPLNTAAPLVVRLRFKDLAGNAAEDEKTVPGGIATAAFNNPVPPNTLAAKNGAQPALPSANPPLPPPVAPTLPGLPPPAVEKQLPLVLPGNDHAVPTHLQPQPQPTLPTPGAGSAGEIIPSKDHSQGSVVPGPTAPAAPSAQPSSPTTAKVQLVNDKEILLEYEVAKVGPSGIGSVEVWITRDGGSKWDKFATDPDAPLATTGGKYQRTLELPGDGVYGISLVVKSKVGMGKPAPRPGEAPQMVVEVDTLAPDVKHRKPIPDTMRPNAMVLGWIVTDRNLGPEPITLEWAEQPNGPWMMIAGKLPNTGSHSWQLPQKMPSYVYLRLTARDNAGNVAVAVTAEPQLIDMSVPEGHIISVGVANKKN